ncbi:MAG: hypothetical protein ACHQAX_07705 [Gammaproteobacteria bacterium]
MAVTFKNNELAIISLTKNDSAHIHGLPGLSTKDIQRGTDGHTYLIKSVKNRTITDIFGADYVQHLIDNSHISLSREMLRDIFINTTMNNVNSMSSRYLSEMINNECTDGHSLDPFQRPEVAHKIKADMETVWKVINHVSDTLCTFMHSEILGPKVARALWGDAIVVPDTFYPAHYNPQNPQVISRFLRADSSRQEDQFCEFLQPKINAYALKILNDLPLPKFMDLKNECGDLFTLSEENALSIKSPRFWTGLQKIEPTAQLPRLKDLNLNNLQKQIIGKLYAVALITGHYDVFNNIDGTNSGSIDGKPVSVDWGNGFISAFGGLTKVECTDTARIQLLLEKDARTLQQEWTSRPFNIRFNEHVMPFSDEVFPYLPRMLVQDLYDLNDPDIFAGFNVFVEIAYQNLNNLKQAFTDAWPDNKVIEEHLLDTQYHPDKCDELCAIIHNRTQQLKHLLGTLNGCPDKKTEFQVALLSAFQEQLQAAYSSPRKHYTPAS